MRAHGFQPKMQSLSASQTSVILSQSAPPDYGYSEIPAYSRPNRSQNLDSSESQLDTTQIQLHQSQLNQSQLQLHPEPATNWADNQVEPAAHPGPDLIQLGGLHNKPQPGRSDDPSVNQRLGPAGTTCLVGRQTKPITAQFTPVTVELVSSQAEPITKKLTSVSAQPL